MVKLRDRIKKMHNDTSQGKYAFLVYTLRDTGEVIGFGSYNPFECIEPAEFLSNADLPAGPKCVCDIGVLIDHRYWRKGYGLEVLVALIEHAIKEIGCELFLFETGIENEPWRGLMHSAGLGRFETRSQSSDGDGEEWHWRFDLQGWHDAKQELVKKGKWPV